MGDIRAISTNELKNDMAASLMEQRTYERLLPFAPPEKREEMEERVRVNGQIVAAIKAELERRETAVLIACSKKKRQGRWPAGELYEGELFKAQLAYARDVLGMADDQIFILSAKYGLVGLAQELEPYDLMLAQLTEQERRQWGAKVIDELGKMAPFVYKVVLLAGKVYRDAISPGLRIAQIAIDTAVPAGLGYGQQVAWFKRQVANGREV